MKQLYDSRSPFRALQGKDPDLYFQDLPTPAYLIDVEQLRENGSILQAVAEKSGAKILLAQKAFSNFDFYPVLSPFLDGTSASGLYEARLGSEKMPGKEVHVYSCAYKCEEFARLLRYADHIVFNSVSQLEAFGPTAAGYGKSIGLRVNPQHSTQNVPIYDPCSPGCRLGITRKSWDRYMNGSLLSLVEGLHFHTLCEQGADALESTLRAVRKQFGDVLKHLRWLNMGGGEAITEPGYDTEKLLQCIALAQKLWDVQIYLEPGEAAAHNAGFLITRVLDIVENGDIPTAVMDASPCCHMPDVLEMPYTPMVFGACSSGRCTYSLAGPTCLAGDVLGVYTFPEPLHVGSTLVLGDMAVYTTCKNNMFNGMALPDLWAWKNRSEFRKLTHFSYSDFESRLGSVQGRPSLP